MHGLVIKFQHTFQGTVQYDSTPRLSKGIQNKYVGFMQRKPKKKKRVGPTVWRSTAWLDGISNKDNAFRHGT